MLFEIRHANGIPSQPSYGIDVEGDFRTYDIIGLQPAGGDRIFVTVIASLSRDRRVDAFCYSMMREPARSVTFPTYEKAPRSEEL